MSAERFLDIATVASRLSLSPDTVKNWIKRGILTAHEIDGVRCIEESTLASIYQPSEPKPRPPREYVTPFLTQPPRCGVYFLKCEGFIKIGSAVNVEWRIAKFTLYNPFPITVVHFIACDSLASARSLETALHRRFAHAFHRREWFRDCVEIGAFISAGQRSTQWP